MLKNDVSKYLDKTKKSHQLYEKAKRIFAGGTSHNARFFEPYPFFVRKAQGKYLWDVDGNKYTDYWTGHTALILGHSPKIVAEALEEQSENGTLFGTVAEQAVELGEIVRSNVPCAKLIRFCNTGAEATMYAVRLARAFTGRRVVAKAEGGWHGYNTTLLKGVTSPFEVPESAGLIEQGNQFVRTFKFNDIGSVENLLRGSRGEVACIILEPVLGGGGCIPPAKEFLSSLREVCTSKEIVLVFDEIITGFRLAFGGAQEYYGVIPDLATFGKILGGGLPVGAIAGLEEIMELADTSARKEKTERCWIGGGTFSDNPMTMAAGLATLRFLGQNKNKVYEKLGTLGNLARDLIDASFKEEGFSAKTTGAGSLLYTHFLHEGQRRIDSASEAARANTQLEKDYYFSLIANNDIFFLPGHLGAISLEHTEEDVRTLALASRQFAERHEKLVQSVSPKLV